MTDQQATDAELAQRALAGLRQIYADHKLGTGHSPTSAADDAEALYLLLDELGMPCG